MVEQLILVVSLMFFLGYAALIIFYRQSWLALPGFTANSLTQPKTKISIIVPARNEEQRIGPCLDSLLNQSYPQAMYEVLVVNDHSTDNTAGIILSYDQYNVRLLNLEAFVEVNGLNAYKKKAIEIAIGRSTGDLIITTDADCIVPPGWLRTIADFYEKTGAAFIAMPVSYQCNHHFLEVFQALDFMTLQGITGASVHRKMHRMCNGANLAYEKKAFIAVDGFKGIDHIASGDDMLLMQKIYDRFPERTQFLKSADVIVSTMPMGDLRSFLNQRIRWASKADKYKDPGIILVLALVYLFNLWFVVLAIASFFLHNFYYLPGLLILKILVELFFLYPVAKFFNKTTLLWWFPLAQPFHIIYTIVAGWLGKFGSYQWKGRRLK